MGEEEGIHCCFRRDVKSSCGARPQFFTVLWGGVKYVGRLD